MSPDPSVCHVRGPLFQQWILDASWSCSARAWWCVQRYSCWSLMVWVGSRWILYVAVGDPIDSWGRIHLCRPWCQWSVLWLLGLLAWQGWFSDHLVRQVGRLDCSLWQLWSSVLRSCCQVSVVVLWIPFPCAINTFLGMPPLGAQTFVTSLGQF